jgi:regulator of cell morphogenesis and NO signaling
MRTHIDSTARLGDIVADRPASARVLDRFGLDYCCRGQRTLADACTTLGIDVVAVVDALGDAPATTEAWTDLGPAALTDHLVSTHHAYLWDELPLLEALAEKVRRAHVIRHPELVRVRDLVAEVRAELEPHLTKEERVLFPAIRAAEAGTRQFPFGSMANPVRAMLAEHDRAGELLVALRSATADYAVPSDACASYRSLFERLEVLEHDTHVHIHKENHMLFPAVLVLVETA